MHTLEVVEIEDDALGVILPNALVERFQLLSGGVLYCTMGPDRSIMLTTFDPERRNPAKAKD